MPIRFRCAYCSQLMSIAARKAGTVIRCTKCAGEIIVPMLEEETAPESAETPSPGQVFESAHFDAELSVQAPSQPPPSAPRAEPRSAGIFLSIVMLLVSIGVVVLLLILMFVAGFVIGRATVE